MCDYVFRFSNDMVTIIVRKNKTKDYQDRVRTFVDYEKESPTFCLQLLISYTKKRRIPQLEWKKYSVIFSSVEQISNIKICYPAPCCGR